AGLGGLGGLGALGVLGGLGALGRRLGACPAPPVPLEAALHGSEQLVVVARDLAVHPALEAEAAHPRVERLVRLREVDAGRAVAEILEPGEAGGAGPQRLADRVVAPRLVRLHLGEPLPRLADTARAEDAGHLEGAVAHEALADLVAGVEDLDARHAV